MRRVLAALVLLTSGWAGCLSDGESVTIASLDAPEGTLVTYEVTANGTTTNETYVVAPTGSAGVDLWPHNATREGFASPFLHLDETLTPKGFAWSDLFSFPIEAGDTYSAQVGGVTANVTLEGTTYTVAGEQVDAVRAEATAEGETVATVTVLASPTVPAEVEFDTPVNGEQSWTLTDLGFQAGWNDVPVWEEGDWWRYDATTRDRDGNARHSNATLVYNANATNDQGVKQRVLNPQTVDSRLTTFPFHKLRDRDIAPQSGFLTSTVSSFWAWPLEDGKTWSGTSGITGGDYVAEVTRETTTVADRYTTVYRVDARPAQQSGAEPFASWGYAPAAGFITHMWAQYPDSGEKRFDWTLTDWGTGFQGEMEIPHREAVYGQNHTTGPHEATETFQTPNRTERLQLQGTVARSANSSAELTFELKGPDGETAWRINESVLGEERVHRFNTAIDGEEGTWTLETRIEQDVSYFMQIRALWLETKTVDYS